MNGFDTKPGHGHLSPVPEVKNALCQDRLVVGLGDLETSTCFHNVDNECSKPATLVPRHDPPPLDLSPRSHSASDPEETPTVTPFQVSSPALSPAQSVSILGETYRQALLQAQEASQSSGEEEEHATFLSDLAALLIELQGQGHAPVRPSSQRMELFFKGTPLPIRSTGKGSKGGMRYHDCCWPGCDVQTTLQKCIDHFFSKHVRVKFFPCTVKDCDRAFTRKFDLDKHLCKIHGIERPRAAARAASGSKGDNRATPY